jgi:hypothetical protein
LWAPHGCLVHNRTRLGHALDGILADVIYRTTFRSPDIAPLLRNLGLE